MSIKFNIELLDKKCKPKIPTNGDAGFDLRYRSEDNSILRLKPNERKLVKTGVILELQEGYEAQIRPRSGLALKNGITIVNSPGTIDWSYRNELGVILLNTSKEVFIVEAYDRICQMVIKPVLDVKLEIVDKVNKKTIRGTKGFGSSGIK